MLDIFNKIYINLSTDTSLTIANKSGSVCVKEINKLFFNSKAHVSLMQLIESSNELSLVHASLNILIQLSTIEYKHCRFVSYINMFDDFC